MTSTSLPDHLVQVKERALRALAPIRAATSDTEAPPNLLLVAKRTDAGRSLPAHYLVRFLFIELLGFPDLGRFEKIAWSVPIEFRGKAYLVEHRKFGLGLFAADPESEPDACKEIVKRIHNAVKAARPFFDWLAEQAVDSSKVNVINNHFFLSQRYEFLRGEHIRKEAEAVARKDEVVNYEVCGEFGSVITSDDPAFNLSREARWLAVSAIEAFFSWTEHVLIHISVLAGKISTAAEVARLADADWPTKFKTAVAVDNADAKKVFDKTMALRRELRNFIAHGAFGKDGEAFQFHSRAGAVPVLLPHKRGSKRFRLGDEVTDFDVIAAFAGVDELVQFLWSGARAPARLYVEGGLDLVLTWAADGTYATAMESEIAMEALVDRRHYQIDQSANMDW